MKFSLELAGEFGRVTVFAFPPLVYFPYSV